MQQDVDRHNILLVGERFKSLRLDISPSLNKFVFERGGLSTATLSRIENGISEPKLCTLIKFSGILGITLNELFNDVKFDYTVYDD